MARYRITTLKNRQAFADYCKGKNIADKIPMFLIFGRQFATNDNFVFFDEFWQQYPTEPKELSEYEKQIPNQDAYDWANNL